MKKKQLKLNINSIDLTHQHFFYFDEDNSLKTTIETWPNLKPITTLNNVNHKAFKLLLIIESLVSEKKVLQISRSTIFRKSQYLVKNATNLNKLLYFLSENGYIHFQSSDKYGRNQLIALNPKVFL